MNTPLPKPDLTANYIAEDVPLVPYGDNQFQTASPITLNQLCAAMSLLLEFSFKREPALTSPELTLSYLKAKLAQAEREIFSCIYLDNQHRAICYEKLFYGTIDGASVYPREVVKSCLKHNAAAVILAHNHPSGIAEPSTSDKDITQRLKTALATVDIRVLDHIIIGGSESFSFAEEGLL